MEKCSFKMKEGYECPNEAQKDGLCYLHFNSNTIPVDSAILKIMRKELDSLFITGGEEIIIQNIYFPENFELRLPNNVGKPLYFRDCYLSSMIEINGSHRLVSIEFEDCYITTLRIRGLEASCSVNVKDCKIEKDINISRIYDIDFNLNVFCQRVKNIHIHDVHLKSKLEIIAEDFIESFSITESSFLDSSKIQISLKPTDRNKIGIKFYDVNFVSRFDIITESRVKFYACAIDGLFIRDFELRNNYKNPNSDPNEGLDEKYIFKKPFLFKKLRKVPILFKSINDEDLSEFVDYVRNMKTYFRETEHRELYDLYYILDQYYSRKLPSYARFNRFINNGSRWFSFYGYSITRPVYWLLSVLITFTFIYSWIDYGFSLNIFSCDFWGNFWKTAIHHVNKISFFRSYDDWLSNKSGKSLVFILELLLLIPIFTSIVLGIRKLFKRT